MNETELAISIARCAEVVTARSKTNHPCSKIVNLQPDPSDHQVPEPWFGNLSEAKILFIASNPSINPSTGPWAEVYPRANWSDQAIAEWVLRRVDQSWDAVPVTFGKPPLKDFLVRCENGEYRNDGPRPLSPQPSWNGVHQRAVELLGQSASPSINYALTEVVHCKSKAAVGVPEALAFCGATWMEQILSTAVNVRLVVLLGSHARNWAITHFALHSDFACPIEQGGIEAALNSSFVAELNDRRSMPFFALPHPTSQAKGGTKFVTRFGESCTSVLSKIARGEISVPSSTEVLSHLLSS